MAATPLPSQITVSDLASAGGVGQVALAWTNGEDHCLSYRRRAVVEIWAATSNNRALATKVGESAGNFFSHVASRQTRYYWARVRDVSGGNGPWFPDSATAGVAGLAEQAASADLAPASVDNSQLASGAVTVAKMNVSQLSAITANLGTINTGTLNAVSINSGTFSGAGVISTITSLPSGGEAANIINTAAGGYGISGRNTGGGTGVRAIASGGAGGVGLEAITSDGQIAIISSIGSASGTSISAHMSSASYAGPGIRATALRAASSAYSFFVARSSFGADTEFNLRGDGEAFADGSWTGGGADYAEYFEALRGTPIPVGASVVLVGDKVRAATVDDHPEDIFGVVRPKGASVVVGNAGWNRWSGKYLKDDYGAPVMEDYTVYRWAERETERVIYEWRPRRGAAPLFETDADRAPRHADRVEMKRVVIRESEDRNAVPPRAIAYIQQRRVLNTDYNPAAAYIPRSERPEWHVIGLMGQIPVTRGQPVNPSWRKMRDISATVEMWLVR